MRLALSLDLASSLATGTPEPAQPSTLPNVIAFFRGDTSSSGASWSNQTVSSVTALTQAVAGKQPTAGSFSRGSLLFDGVDDQMDGGAISEWITSTAGAVYVLYKPIAATINNARADLNHTIWSNSGGYAGLFLRATPDVIPWNYDGTNDTGNAVASPFGAAQVVRWRHAGGNIYARVGLTEGVGVASGATAFMGGALAIGGSGVFSPCANVDIAAIVTLKTDPTAGEDTTIMDWMNWYRTY